MLKAYLLNIEEEES